MRRNSHNLQETILAESLASTTRHSVPSLPQLPSGTQCLCHRSWSLHKQSTAPLPSLHPLYPLHSPHPSSHFHLWNPALVQGLVWIQVTCSTPVARAHGKCSFWSGERQLRGNWGRGQVSQATTSVT